MKNHKQLVLVLLACIATLTGCGAVGNANESRTAADSARADSTARARQDSSNRARSDYVVDSILPIEEELRRFRIALGGDSAAALVGGGASREELVQRFMRALSSNDTADFRAMVISGREFADLYYPESPYTHPPYRQSPAFAWTLIQNPSTSGLLRLLQKLGGKPMKYSGHLCDPKVAVEGQNIRYAGCLVQVIGEKGDTVALRLFGSIVERNGQFKFLSYSNLM